MSFAYTSSAFFIHFCSSFFNFFEFLVFPSRAAATSAAASAAAASAASFVSSPPALLCFSFFRVAARSFASYRRSPNDDGFGGSFELYLEFVFKLFKLLRQERYGITAACVKIGNFRRRKSKGCEFRKRSKTR